MKRMPQLDGLRGIAILMVFATHALNIRGLWMGVDLFFALSGYLITRILLELKLTYGITEYWQSFYFRRAKRILPPFLGFMIFVAIGFTPHWHRVWLCYLCFASNFPLAFGRVPINAVSPLWSLAVEEQFYLIWPLAVLLCRNGTLRRVALAVLLIAPVLRALATPLFHSHMPIYSLTPFRADTLACGAFIAICQNENPGWIKSKRIMGMAGAITAAFVLISLAMFPWFRTGGNNVLFNSLGYSLSTLMFGGTLVYALSGNGVLIHLLRWSGLRYLGRISYTFYLYHVAVMSLLERQIHSFIPLAFTSFFFTFAISSLSWHFIESPILKRRGEKDAVANSKVCFLPASPAAQGQVTSA